MKFLFSINPIKTLKFFKLNIYISLLSHSFYASHTGKLRLFQQ